VHEIEEGDRDWTSIAVGVSVGQTTNLALRPTEDAPL